MEDKDILRHLLEIEGQAAALVDEAQEKADKRIKAAEEQFRLSYEEEYQKLTAELDAEFAKEGQAIKAEYEKALDEYRTGFNQMPRDYQAFNTLASRLLAEK